MSDDKESDKACSAEGACGIDSRWMPLASAHEYEIENLGRHAGRVFGFDCRMTSPKRVDESVLQSPIISLEKVNEYLKRNYGKASETRRDELVESPWPSFETENERTPSEVANELQSWRGPVERVDEFESRRTPVERANEFESGTSSDERAYMPMPVEHLQRSQTEWSLTDYLVRRYPRVYAWGIVIGSISLSIGGLVAGGYVLRHAERPAGWAVTAFSIGATGFYLTGKSLVYLCFPPDIEYDDDSGVVYVGRGGSADGGSETESVARERALNYEAEYYIQHPEALRLHQRNIQPTSPIQDSDNVLADPEINRLNSEIYRLRNEISRLELELSAENAGSSSEVSAAASSSLPVYSFSTISTNPLHINLAVNDYRPRTTELSFRPSVESQGKRKKAVTKAWTSAPNVLQRHRDDLDLSMNLEPDVAEVAEEDDAAEKDRTVQEVDEENAAKVLEWQNTVEELAEENSLGVAENIAVEVAEEAIAAEEAEDVIEVAEEAVEIEEEEDESSDDSDKGYDTGSREKIRYMETYL